MSHEHLSRLLQLPKENAQQILNYTNTLSKAEAAEHLSNLLGDSPQALEFISSFNSKRQAPSGTSLSRDPPAASTLSSQPRNGSWTAKQTQFSAPRQAAAGPAILSSVDSKNISNVGNASASRARAEQLKPTAGKQQPQSRPQKQQSKPKQPPSAAGPLISDIRVPKPKSSASAPVQPAPPIIPAAGRSSGATTKIRITGGMPMKGAGTAVEDLDAAIRALEITTNPSLPGGGVVNAAARRCDCVATRHPLQTAAPNCLACGKVVCLKEGLGPCTFCGAALLSSADVHAMLTELKADRGREKMAANNAVHKKAEVGRQSAMFSRPATESSSGGVSGAGGDAMALSDAQARRDRLLNFQAENARRTTVRDEAADFDYDMAHGGTGSLWATPEERARELKRQQKVMREMEWDALPDYEKRAQVISIDLTKGGKVTKKMMAIEKPNFDEDDGTMEDETLITSHGNSSAGQRLGGANGEGAFSRNPLIGAVLKPVYIAKSDASGNDARGREKRESKWRKVQMDEDDNVDVILDGGVFGGAGSTAVTVSGSIEVPRTIGGSDEPACG